MKRPVLIIVALFWILGSTAPIQACECIAYGTPICALYWRSDAVFVGKVVDIRPIKVRPDNTYTYVTATFRVDESFRGASGPRIEVSVASNTLCEPKFKKGKRYVVYATLHRETNQLFTGMCTGTGLADDIDDELKELRKLKQREAGETISGRVVRRRYQGIPGIKVEVTGNDKTFQTLSTDYGDFSVSLPGPGVYKVRVLVPHAVQPLDYSDDQIDVKTTHTDSLSTFEYNVTLEKSQCNFLQLNVLETPEAQNSLLPPRSIKNTKGFLLTH